MTGRLLETHSPQRQQRRVSNLNPVTAVSFPAGLSPHRAPRGGVLGRPRTFFLSLTNRGKPASNPVREGAQGGPGVDASHVPNMRSFHAAVVASDYVTERG